MVNLFFVSLSYFNKKASRANLLIFWIYINDSRFHPVLCANPRPTPKRYDVYYRYKYFCNFAMQRFNLATSRRCAVRIR